MSPLSGGYKYELFMLPKAIDPNLITLPANLKSVTTIANEVSPQFVGLTNADITALWEKIECLYSSRVHPGVSIAIRYKGELILDRAIGHARGNGPKDSVNTEKALLTPETPVCLFSASKGLTAMLVHQLAAEGKIDLESPVVNYIPEFARKGKSNITVAHVLSHRAGIPYIEQDTPDPSLLNDWDAVMEVIYDTKPRYKAGKTQAYHAISGGFILGEILRRVTGKELKDLYKERLQAPLGARYLTLGLEPDEHENVALNYATGIPTPYPMSKLVARALGGSFDMVSETSNTADFMNADVPAGNIYATAKECVDFYQVLLNDGITADGTRMFDSAAITRATTPIPGRHIDRTLVAPIRMSEGMMLGDSPVGLYGQSTQDAFGHLGFLNIFCWADPSRDISVSILSTGKAIIAPHMPSLINLLREINSRFPANA
jgi:CubicO group peptidase (beta-lactamase class C family)